MILTVIQDYKLGNRCLLTQGQTLGKPMKQYCFLGNISINAEHSMQTYDSIPIRSQLQVSIPEFQNLISNAWGFHSHES